jgi:intracellular sulfur oxidation DsrE/DsrF family protein
MSSDDKLISDEHLNAFIDNQLDADEKSRILATIKSDTELSHRACELKRLRELVQHAYELPSERTEHGGHSRVVRGSLRAAAALALMILGGAIGWLSHGQQYPGSTPLDVKAMYLDEEKAFQTARVDEAPTVQGGRKILLHISSDDPQKLEQALNTTERLLETYRARHMPVELELVANAGGLNLLRADISPFADRIEDLQFKYEELTFFACQTAINRMLEREHKDQAPPLLPQALTTPNALDQILTRLQEGWVYVSV